MKTWTVDELKALKAKARLLGFTMLHFSARDFYTGEAHGYVMTLYLATGDLLMGEASCVVDDETPLHRWLYNKHLISASPAFAEFYTKC